MSSLETYSVSLNNFLNSYLAYLREPITTLENQRSQLEVKSAVFTDLGSKLNALEDAVSRLSASGTSSAFRYKTVTSSAASIATAVATSGAGAGSHSVFVTQLARAHTVASDRYDQDATTLSQSQAGTKTFSVTVAGETYEVSVTISAGESNQEVLRNIASAINEAADGEVLASAVMDTPSTGKLSIRSGSTGTAGEMTFTDDGGLLATLGVTNQTQATDTVGGYVYADLGGNELDALLAVDGINIISSDNVVENVIEGLSITLLAPQEIGDTAVTLTVSVDVESIRAEVEGFLTAYNDVYAYLVEKTWVDGTTYERGLLSGDFSYISLRTNMRQAMNTMVEAAGFDYQALSQIGIGSTRSGNYSVTDSSLLEDVIASDPEALENLFGSESGIATALESLLSRYTGAGGTISASKDGLNSRMDRIDDQIERKERYLELREKELRRQYAALQEALATLELMTSITNSFSNLVGL
jgi:flagellar hook-associated protein 2